MVQDRSPGAGSDFHPPKESSVLKQFGWLMIWPTLTVILVVVIAYLDRMHTFRTQTVHQETIRLSSLQMLFQNRNESIVSDLKYLGRSPDLTAVLISPRIQEDAALVETLFETVLSGKPHYARLRLLNSEGHVLVETLEPENFSAGAAIPLDNLESAAFVRSLFAAQKPDTFLLASFESNNSGTRHATTSGSLWRMYHVVEDDQHRPIGILSIDYMGANILNAVNRGSDQQFRKIVLLNESTIIGSTMPSISNGGESEIDENAQRSLPLPSTIIGSDEFMRLISTKRAGHFTLADNLYVFLSINPLPSFVTELDLRNDTISVHESDEPGHWYLASEVHGDYFAFQKWYILKILLLFGVALLLPPIFFCLFLARARVRIRRESALRFQEHQNHLEQLEVKVHQRTRELDESNKKLNAEILDRLSAEQQLRLNNELLSGMIGSIDGIIYVSDFDTHEILFANEYLRQLFGFDPVGRLCWQFLHSNQEGPCAFCTNQRLLDEHGNPTPPVHWEYQNPFNKKWYAAKDQAILWSSGKYVRLEIAIDITEQKRLQNFLREARKQAELAIGIRSRFVALVAHDLKSPFFSITQMLKRILDRETFTYKVHRQFLENIVQNGHRMLQMIDNLLSMDRFETGEMRLDRIFFDVSEMSEEVMANFKHPAQLKKLTLVNDIPPETTLYADKYLYYVVLNNLVSNAVKFSEEKGTIVIGIAREIGSATVLVRDNGKGMSAEYAQNLFREDVKTSSKGTLGEQGSGLGLIFCQDILKAHHGEITVTSEVGIGTTFFIELPPCSDIEQEHA